MTAVKHETCARCGHTTPGCERCDRQWPFLGGLLGGNTYCHTYVVGSSTCYGIESARGERRGRWT